MAEKVITLTNGDKVIVDEDRKRSTSFNLDDLYRYRLVDDSSAVVEGAGEYVPNVGDMIWSFGIGLLRVSRVDYTNYVADLVLWELPKTASEVGVEDVLLGVGPGYSSESWRCLIDTRVFPYRLDIDSKLHSYGTDCKEVIVFRGINTSETGTVISGMYQQGGEFIPGPIPLELVKETEGVTNIAEYAPVMGYTTTQLPDGEVVTVVTYNTDGAPTSYNKMLVMNTNITRHPEDPLRRITAIEIVSPWLSQTEPNTLEFPINGTVSQLVMRGKVTYSNGDTALFDLTDEAANGKCKVLGLKYWSPTITGARQEFHLCYSPDPDEEYAYLQGVTANGDVLISYSIVATPVDPAYSLKLYAFPVWKGATVGYQLDYWLYDLNRAIARHVPTGAVELSEASAAFDGHLYTTVQYIQVQVNLSAMDPSYGDHKHVQSLQIALLRDGSIRQSNWRVKFSGNQPNWYGDTLEAAVHAIGSGLSTVNIAQGLTSQTDWLNKLYYNLSPLYDPQTETQAPAPTHVLLTTKTRTYEIPVGQWSNDITFINDLGEGEVLFLRWIKRAANGDLQLAAGGLPVHMF